MKKSVKNLT